MPPQTLEATLDHARVEPTIREGLDEAKHVLMKLANWDIDLESIASRLLRDGVRLFADSFDSLLADIEKRRHSLAVAGGECESFGAVG
jgi:transaldolase